MKKWSIAFAMFVLLLWLTPSYVGPGRLFLGGFGLFAAAAGFAFSPIGL